MELGISSSMLSHYLTGRTTQPSLEVAIDIYKREKIVIWPYSLYAVSEGKEGEE
jgi:transcriptional regulator with XRE-family HTH domain